MTHLNYLLFGYKNYYFVIVVEYYRSISMTKMSKLFRARNLDAGKPMPIFMSEEIPDLEEYLAVNRAVPEFPTGVLKEEEREHHLQRAIGSGLIIPTPETEIIDSESYDRIYPKNYKVPRQLIRVQPFDIEQDIPDYDMDSEDEAWINAHVNTINITPFKFEEIMDCLENNGHSIMSQYEAKLLIKEDDDLLIAVYDYWLNKRLNTQHPLVPRVKTEPHLVGNSYNHPYLAFQRHRKMLHTRKKQKNRESSYQKMIKLRRDLCRALKLLELIKQRENSKKQLLQLTIKIFEMRYDAGDFSGQMLNEVTPVKNSRSVFAPIFTNQLVNQTAKEFNCRKEKQQYKKRKLESGGETVSIMDYSNIIASADDNSQLRDLNLSSFSPVEEAPFVFHRREFSLYHHPIKNIQQEDPQSTRSKIHPLSIEAPHSQYKLSGTGRIGRGGRLILARGFSPKRAYDNFWEACDYTILDSSQGKSPCVSDSHENIELYKVDIPERSFEELNSATDSSNQVRQNLDMKVILQMEDLSNPQDNVPFEVNFSDLTNNSFENNSQNPESMHLLDLILQNSSSFENALNQVETVVDCEVDVKTPLKSDNLSKDLSKNILGDLRHSCSNSGTNNLLDGLLRNNTRTNLPMLSKRENKTDESTRYINDIFIKESASLDRHESFAQSSERVQKEKLKPTRLNEERTFGHSTFKTV